MKTCSLFYTALAVTLFVSPLAHAKDDFVGTFGNWHVQTYVEGGSRVCLMWSQPENQEQISAAATSMPMSRSVPPRNISTKSVFPLVINLKESALSVLIGKSKHTMLTDGDTAWNRKPLDDAKMVKAMRAGAKNDTRVRPAAGRRPPMNSRSRASPRLTRR